MGCVGGALSPLCGPLWLGTCALPTASTQPWRQGLPPPLCGSHGNRPHGDTVVPRNPQDQPGHRRRGPLEGQASLLQVPATVGGTAPP